MRPLNAFAAARLDRALERLDEAVRVLDGPVDRHARAALLGARSHLHAMRQLLRLEAELADVEAKTDLGGARL